MWVRDGRKSYLRYCVPLLPTEKQKKKDLVLENKSLVTWAWCSGKGSDVGRIYTDTCVQISFLIDYFCTSSGLYLLGFRYIPLGFRISYLFSTETEVKHSFHFYLSILLLEDKQTPKCKGV